MKTHIFLFASILALTVNSGFCKTIAIVKKSNEPKLLPGYKRDIVPQKYLNITIDVQQLFAELALAPMEFETSNPEKYFLELPNPEGINEVFEICKSPIMEDGLAKQFPNIQTFNGQSANDPTQTIWLDFTEFGFHAMILSPKGTWFIDPYSKQNTTNYISYYKKDYVNVEKINFYELPPINIHGTNFNAKSSAPANCIGDKLRTYRLAVACTGEYSVAVAGANATTAQVLSAITTSIHRVDGIYETELAIKLVLVATETNVIFLNPSTDPFNGNNSSNTLIGESQNVIVQHIQYSNFDIGHTFSTGGGGLANLGCVCDNGTKASGITGSPNPVGDAYDVDYVAHEMGHQFGGNHTFNSMLGSCNGNINNSTAMEVGSGTTIMAYAGICGTDNTQTHSDAFFHSVSYDEIINYTYLDAGNSCPVITNTSNHSPSVIMPISGKAIPKKTPFVLTGDGADVDGDALTFCWEEMDAGQTTTWNGGASTVDAPIFKSRVPIVSKQRYFPSLAVIRAGYPTNPSASLVGANNLKGELLPQIGRIMNFRLTVRDNKAGGGGVATGGNGCSDSNPFIVEVVDEAGPFLALIPNGGEIWDGATYQTFTWDVAGTNTGFVNCANVDILYSTDGGVTFADTVVAGVPNTGSCIALVPNIPTNTTVRVMIKCSDNYFFDISNANFKINFNPNPSAVKTIDNQIGKVVIAPNPAHNILQIMLRDFSLKTNSVYQITDNIGNLIKEGNFFNNSNNIDISTLSNGVFFIKIINGEQVVVNKFIKQ